MDRQETPTGRRHLSVALVQQPEELLFESLCVNVVIVAGHLVLLLLLLQQGLLLQEATQQDRQRGRLTDAQQGRLGVQMTATVRLAQRRRPRPIPIRRRRSLRRVHSDWTTRRVWWCCGFV